MEQREVVCKRCDDKQYFKYIGKASEIAQKLSKRLNKLMVAYKCLDCDGYHVGSADLTQRLAHVSKPRKETWKDIKVRALKNSCSYCKAAVGEECMQDTAINGHTVKTRMIHCHKGRVLNV